MMKEISFNQVGLEKLKELYLRWKDYETIINSERLPIRTATASTKEAWECMKCLFEVKEQ